MAGKTTVNQSRCPTPVTALYHVGSRQTYDLISFAYSPITIGRARCNHIQILDLNVSLQHCELTWQNDQLWVEDTGSTNGTFLNHVFVERAPMEPGMLLALGSAELYVKGNECVFPFIVKSVTSLLSRAYDVYGSLRKAEAQLKRGRSTIARARRKRGERMV